MSNSLSMINTFKNTDENQNIINNSRRGRFTCFVSFSQTILMTPFTSSVKLLFRTVKLLTFVPVKAGALKISGYHTESSSYMLNEYLRSVKAVRDLLFIPSVANRSLIDMVSKRELILDDIDQKTISNILNVKYVSKFEQYSSSLHGMKTFEIINPELISEFPATNDPTLKVVMASNIFKPGILGIQFGNPNVATFINKLNMNGDVQTYKVDAKSLWNEKMTYHETNGKIQSGIFLIPTNLPDQALEEFEKASKELQGRKDITCVNTNCRILHKAGFCIEGVKMDDVILPTTLMEHLLCRNVFFKDLNGVNHKIHFKILNTTDQNIEKYFENVDTAVVGTRFRHRARHTDTEENQIARGLAAKALIAEENVRLKAAGPLQEVNDDHLEKRIVTVSVPSYLGEAISRIWGRHTMYELDLSENKQDIMNAFVKFTDKLHAFPQEKPSLATRIKRDFFFSGPMINFLRRHMMGREDVIYLHTQDIFNHLKSTNGDHLNYVLLDDKMVIARVSVNGLQTSKHRKGADWALSKHALLAGRQDVHCSGEMWFEKETNSFVMNGDSGTYVPNDARVLVVVTLANQIFKTEKFNLIFKTMKTKNE